MWTSSSIPLLNVHAQCVVSVREGHKERVRAENVQKHLRLGFECVFEDWRTGGRSFSFSYLLQSTISYYASLELAISFISLPIIQIRPTLVQIRPT